MKIQFDEIIVHLILHKPWKYENVREWFYKLKFFHLTLTWHFIVSCTQHRDATPVYIAICLFV